MVISVKKRKIAMLERLTKGDLEKVAEIEDEAKLMSEFNKPNNSVSGLPE